MTDSRPAQWTNFRDIPLEVLRDFVCTRAEDSSIRQVAVEMGLGRTTLHSFMYAETTPHPRIRRKIALCYLEWLQTAPDMDLVRPYAAALDVLIEGCRSASGRAPSKSFWTAWNWGTSAMVSRRRAGWNCCAC